MPFRRITKRDNPANVANRTRYYEQLLQQALSIASKHLNDEPKELVSMMTSASVQGGIPGYKVASIEFQNPITGGRSSSNMSWDSLEDLTPEDLAADIVVSVKDMIEVSKAGKYQKAPARLRFEARDLDPHLKYVNHKTLTIGEVYFVVDFLDEDDLIPSLEPVVYIGRNLTGRKKAAIYFQDFRSYKAGVRFPPQRASDADFISFHPWEHFILDYEQALNRLLRCSIERKKLRKS